MSVMTDVKQNSRKEALVVMAAMGGILIPLRFLTIALFNDNWIGSLGVITAVTLVIITLAKKRKLGKFGDMLLRQLTHFHSSKRRWVTLGFMAFLVVYASASIYMIHQGNTVYLEDKLNAAEEISGMGINNYEDVMRQSGQMSIQEHAESAAKLPTLAIKEFRIVAVSMAIVNDMMDNWFLFFATLILVESAEVLGLLVITSRFTKKATV